MDHEWNYDHFLYTQVDIFVFRKMHIFNKILYNLNVTIVYSNYINIAYQYEAKVLHFLVD